MNGKEAAQRARNETIIDAYKRGEKVEEIAARHNMSAANVYLITKAAGGAALRPGQTSAPLSVMARRPEEVPQPEPKAAPAAASSFSSASTATEKQEPPAARPVVLRSLLDAHPFIRGLFEVLPPPKSAWSGRERRAWLQAAEGIFGLIYEEENHDRKD